MMTAPEHDLKDRGIDQVTALLQPLTEQAVRDGHLRSTVDAEHLCRHLVITLLAIVGMWGGGILSIDEVIQQVEQAWCSSLLYHCNAELEPILQHRLNR